MSNRLMLEYVFELDGRVRRGERPNASALAREWGLARQTVQRYVEYLRDRLGAPLAWDQERNGYRYEDDSWVLPALDLSEGELFQLAVAQRLAEQDRGTPLGNALQSLMRKLRQALPDAAHVSPLDLGGRFSFHGQPARPVSPATWRTLARATRESRTVKLEYRAFDSARTTRPEVEPWHLANVEGDWYLLARWPPHAEPAVLAVSRIVRARAGRRSFERPRFEPDRFFANRFGRFVGKPGAEHRVVLRFDADQAAGVLEREWHPKQEAKRHEDGSVTLVLPVPSLHVARRWALQWGGSVEVLEPAGLREDLRREAERMAARHARRAESAHPARPEQPAQPARPARPQQAAQPARPAQPPRLGRSEQPPRPARSARPEQPARSAQPARPEQPARPARPTSRPTRGKERK